MTLSIITGVSGLVVGQITIAIFFLVKDRKLNRAWKKREMETREDAARQLTRAYEDGWDDGNARRY